ncbi:MAG: MBL fold metallo-hydrolase, partial [Planctomycetaceae bacterium]
IEAESLPVFIYITHCHVDHCLMLSKIGSLKEMTDVKVAIQEEGAKLLIAGDGAVSMADLYGYPISSFTPHIQLLSLKDKTDEIERKTGGERNFVSDSYVENFENQTSRPFFRQQISIGDRDVLEVYHTPGHSPDSVCFRLGEVLFISDLLFAIGPMVAGITGWNRQDYIDSVHNVMWLLDSLNIKHCYSGHGDSMDAGVVKSMLLKILEEEKGLSELTEFNRERLQYVKQHAIDTLEEVGNIFTIIAGRIYTLSYYLDRLEESKAAEKFNNLLDADKIEQYLLDFNDLIEKVRASEKLDLHLVRAAQKVVQKIMRIFDEKQFENIIHPSFLRRASALLKDFLSLVRGINYQVEQETFELNGFVKILLKDMSSSLYTDESIFESLDNDDAFINSLAARIAHVPIFRDVEFGFKPAKEEIQVYMDRQRFGDAFQGLSEQIAIAGAKDILITTFNEHRRAGIKIIVRGFKKEIIPERKFNMHCRRFLTCGVHLRRLESDTGRGVCLDFSHGV